MKAVAGETITALAGVRGKLRGALESFKDLLVTDSTVIRLHWMLEKVFPACRTNHTRAAAKLHVVMSVKGAGMKSLKISSERCHDGPVLTVGKWVKERLLLFDLGYFRWQLFDCITRNGGYFISRLKANANPVITGVNHSSSSYWQSLVGRRLWDFLPGLRREAIDMEIEVSFRRRQYRGTRRGGTARFRLVGVRDPSWGGHHLYVTNVPADKLSAEDVARTYSARWWVELLFKEMKQAYRLEQMPSGKKHIVESLLYGTILTLIASRQLMQAVRQKLRSEAHRLRHQRFAAVFASMAPHILLLLVQRPVHTQLILRLVSSTMLVEAVDPNASRQGLIESVETRTHHYDARRCLNHGL
jgi:putative transposase